MPHDDDSYELHPEFGTYQVGPEPRHRWYTRKKAAEEMDVSVRTIQRWILTGRLTQWDGGWINAAELVEVEHERRHARNPGRPGPRVRPCLTP